MPPGRRMSARTTIARATIIADVNADPDVDAAGLNIDRPIAATVTRIIDQRPPFANNNNNPPIGHYRRRAERFPKMVRARQ